MPEVFSAENEKAVNMAGLLSYVPRKACPILKEKLKEHDMEELYLQIERPTTATLYDMEKYGISVEKDALKEYGEQLTGRIEELEESIHTQAGKDFNINSPKQLGVVLFEDLKMPFAKKTKTGYSTSADTLEKLAPDYPIVSDILEYRQLTKLKSTYAGRTGCLYRRRREDSQRFSPEGDRHRTVVQFRSESSEYSDSDAAGTGHPESVCAGTGICVCQCRLFAD